MNSFLVKSDNSLSTDFEKVVSEYMPVLKVRAAYFSTCGADYDELLQEGMMGLYSAFIHYDKSKNAEFKTFALHCINNRMISYLRASGKNNNITGEFVSLSGDDFDNILPKEMSFQLDPQQILEDNESFEKSKQQFFSVLSDYEKDILTLYLGGHSCKDIAKELSVSYKSADNAIQRIKRKLKNPDK